MNFSDIFKQSSGHAAFSPDCTLLASAVSFRVVIRDASNLEVVHIWKCLDEVNFLEWSPDSSLLVVILKKRNLIQILNIDDTNWKCKLDFAAISIGEVKWAPDSRHLITIDELGVRLQIWSLVNKTVNVISDVKGLKKGVSFFNDRIAILQQKMSDTERNQLDDYVLVLQYRVC